MGILLLFILHLWKECNFNNNEINYPIFINKLHIIVIYGSNKESPLFIPIISNILDDFSKCLPIQRHKYEIKMNDLVIDN